MTRALFSAAATALASVACCVPCAPRCCLVTACERTCAPSPIPTPAPAPPAPVADAAAAPSPTSEYQRAFETAARALQTVPRLVAGLADEQGARARGQHVGLFEIGALAAARLGDVAGATQFLESGRAGSLLESLGAREALRRVVVPDDLVRAEAAARKKEADATAAYVRAVATGELAAIRAARDAVVRAQDDLLDAAERSEREAKRAAHLSYPVATPIEGIQGFLSPGDALVLYGLFEAESLAVVLTRDAGRIVSLGPTAKIVAACAALGSADASTDWVEPLERLRSLLVVPLALEKGTRRLLVSADGPLFRVPFAALVDAIPVVFVPSGTAYGVLREDRARRGERVLALGDPDVRDSEAGAGLPRLVRLPATRLEASAVGDVVLVGLEASESSLLAALSARSRWRALHFASHILIDVDRPRLSAVVLAPDASEDGLLRAMDVSRSKIDADLVVLAACDTARGTLFPVEGLLCLPRSFLMAGVPRVIGALWKVDDEATRALMTKFYELWNPKDGKPGLPTAEALRSAQEYVRSQEKWKHPYFWAAWVLWGLPE